MLAPLQEKRKRSQGQATKGKNFVEEEKRLQARRALRCCRCVVYAAMHASRPARRPLTRAPLPPRPCPPPIAQRNFGVYSGFD